METPRPSEILLNISRQRVAEIDRLTRENADLRARQDRMTETLGQLTADLEQAQLAAKELRYFQSYQGQSDDVAVRIIADLEQRLRDASARAGEDVLRIHAIDGKLAASQRRCAALENERAKACEELAATHEKLAEAERLCEETAQGYVRRGNEISELRECLEQSQRERDSFRDKSECYITAHSDDKRVIEGLQARVTVLEQKLAAEEAAHRSQVDLGNRLRGERDALQENVRQLDRMLAHALRQRNAARDRLDEAGTLDKVKAELAHREARFKELQGVVSDVSNWLYKALGRPAYRDIRELARAACDRIRRSSSHGNPKVFINIQ